MRTDCLSTRSEHWPDPASGGSSSAFITCSLTVKANSVGSTYGSLDPGSGSSSWLLPESTVNSPLIRRLRTPSSRPLAVAISMSGAYH